MDKQKQIQVMTDNKGLTTLPSLEKLQDKLSEVKISSIPIAIQSGFPSIGRINKEFGEAKTNAVLVEMIADISSFLNVGKTMSPFQVTETAKLLRQYFPNLNLADLKLFFERMKLGHYGKFYDRMDGQLILSKLDEYNQERMNEFEQARLAQHRETKRNDVGISGYHESVLKVLKDAIGDKQVFTEKNLAPKTKSDAEIFYDRCLVQFDNIYRKYGKQISSVRFLIIGDTRFTIDKFIERKVNNRLEK